jgi:hypothetical protein
MKHTLTPTNITKQKQTFLQNEKEQQNYGSQHMKCCRVEHL